MTRTLSAGAAGVLGLALAPLLVGPSPHAGAGTTTTCFGEPATIVVRGGGANVFGTDARDVMVVTSHQFVTVYGLRGDDLVCTNGELQGGPGDDRLLGFRRTDIVRELTLLGGPGDDRLYRRGPSDGDPHLEPVMRGGRGDDRLDGGRNMDDLRGGAGSDRLLGRAMWDDLHGGPGRDLLIGAARGDEMFGGGAVDRLFGGGGRDSADGGAADDSCFAELRTNC